MPTFIDYYYNIPDGVVDIIQKSPFAQLFTAIRHELIHVTKSNILLGVILDAYNHEKDFFVFAEKKFKITETDVSNILGLSMDGVEIPRHIMPTSAFVLEEFGNVAELTKGKVLRSIRKHLSFTPEDPEQLRLRDEKLAKLIMMDIFIYLLFPNAKNTLNIEYVKAVDNWGEVSNIAWSKEVHAFLIRSLIKYRKNLQFSYKCTGGCTLLVYVR